MKSLLIFLSAFSLMIVTVSCKKDKAVIGGYDVILVIGQSNTHQGLGYDQTMDGPLAQIKQLGRFGTHNYSVIQASEPLEHLSMLNGHIGFAMPFAKKYGEKYLSPGRHVLIIPASKGSTGFQNHNWNKGDTLYNDALARTRYVLQNFNSKLVAILWHQGENDVLNPDYQKNLDSMITNLRIDLSGDQSVPFILGGMVPYWVNQDSNRIATNTVIRNTVYRLPNTGYADPAMPFMLEKPDNTIIEIHFDAKGQRELGNRYFSEYEKLFK